MQITQLLDAEVGLSVLLVSAPKEQASVDSADPDAVSVEEYNAWAAQREPYSQRVRRWRAESA